MNTKQKTCCDGCKNGNLVTNPTCKAKKLLLEKQLRILKSGIKNDEI